MFVFILNLCVIIINCINMSRYIRYLIIDSFETPMIQELHFYKLIVLIIMLLLVFFIILPENLKYPSYVGTVALIVVIFYFVMRNTQTGFPNFENVVAFNFLGAPSLIGSQLYSLESIGTLFTVRSTMKEKKVLKYLLPLFFLFIVGFFISQGLSFYFAFPSSRYIGFIYYREDTLIDILEFIFYLTCPTRAIIVLIANLTMLEEMDIFRKLIVSPNDPTAIDYKKVTVFRIVCSSIILSFIFLGNFGCMYSLIKNI